MAKQMDTIYLRVPAELLLKDTIAKITARQKDRGNKKMDSGNELCGVILLTFFKTAAACRANTGISVSRIMGVNFAALYNELYGGDSNEQETGV